MKKIVLKSLIGITAFLFVLLLFLPLIIRKVTISQSKDWIGRSVSWEKFNLNYFTGTAKLIDFKLYEVDDSTVFVAFDTLVIDTEPYQMFQNEIVVEQLYLKGFNANVVMYDSAFNFDDILHHILDTVSAETPQQSDDILRFQLSNIELNDALFRLKDASINKQMELSNIDFFIPYLGWNQKDKSEAGLKFDFKNGGYFQSLVNIDPNKGDFEAFLKLKEMDISGYDDFVAKYIDLGSFEGQTDLEVNLIGNIKHPEATVASASIQLYDFELHDAIQNPILALKKLNLSIKEADQANNRIIIDTISLTEPYIYFELYDSTNNIVELINRALPPPDSTQVTAGKNKTDSLDSKLFYAVNSFVIEDGIVDFIDKRTGDPFKYHLSELKVRTDSITSESQWVETQANMLLNERGKLLAELGIDPNNPMDLKVDYTITDFMLSDLNIYSRYYMGFPILYGDMYYKAHTEIQDGELISENKIIIHNVELGNKQGGIHDLPIKFALFLLKDKDGVITLDVPVGGDLKDPQVSVGKIVWNTFKNLIVKAAAAPVKLLSRLIGADPKEIESIEFGFLDTAFTENKQKQLNLLLQLEQQKPELEIELIYFKDPELEGNELALAEAGRLFMKRKNKDYLAHRDEFESFVRKQVKSDTINILAACRKLIDQNVIDSLLHSYDEKRLDNIESYLHQVNDSTEILVIKSKPGAPKNIGSTPVFEVKYGMKEETIQ